MGLAPSDFRIEYSYSDWSRLNFSGNWDNYTYNYSMTLNSDGNSSYDSLYQEEDYWGEYNDSKSFNVTLSPTWAQQVYQSLSQEGFFGMWPIQNDSAAKVPFPEPTSPIPEKRVSVISGENNTTVVFRGDSIFGLMPRSAVEMENTIWAILHNRTRVVDATVGIDANVSAAGILSVKVTVTNNENVTIFGCFEDLAYWNFFIVAANGTYIGSGPPQLFNSWSIGPKENMTFLDIHWTNVSQWKSGKYVIIVYIPIEYSQEPSPWLFYNYTTLDLRGSASAPSLDLYLVGIEFVGGVVGISALALAMVAYLARRRRKVVSPSKDPEVTQDDNLWSGSR